MSDFSRYHVLIPDLAGIFRGLSAPLSDKESLIKNPLSMSASLFSSRFDGQVVEESGMGIARGDPDYLCHYVDNSLVPIPWEANSEQGIYTMTDINGNAYALDPQHLLANVLKTYQQDEIQISMAIEFEFYLSDNKLQENYVNPHCDLYSLEQIQRDQPFLKKIITAAKQQKLPVTNIISEYGQGQWEINLVHTHPTQACLDALCLRRLIRALAIEEGKKATFMAKPFSGLSGSGMHIHLSLWRNGKNVLCDENQLHQAIAGIFDIIPESMVFFAPYDNSYRRFLSHNSYAPNAISWGKENRSAMIRIPYAKTADAKRIEFRLCGSDVNPIIAATALLIGVHWGIQNKIPLTEKNNSAFPRTWHAAINALQNNQVLKQYVAEEFINNYLHVKKNEWEHHQSQVSDYDRLYYGHVI